MSFLGVSFTKILDALGWSVCRAMRSPPCFGLRVLVFQSAVVCPLSYSLVAEYYVSLQCREGFGAAPSVMLVSMIFSGHNDLPLSWLGVCFIGICDAVGWSMCRVLRPLSWFGLRVLVSQLIAVFMLSCSLVAEYYLDL